MTSSSSQLQKEWLEGKDAVDDDKGGIVISVSRRPDGSERKAVRVRQGYIPPDETPAYVAPAVRRQREQSGVSTTPQSVRKLSAITGSPPKSESGRSGGRRVTRVPEEDDVDDDDDSGWQTQRRGRNARNRGGKGASRNNSRNRSASNSSAGSRSSQSSRGGGRGRSGNRGKASRGSPQRNANARNGPTKNGNKMSSKAREVVISSYENSKVERDGTVVIEQGRRSDGSARKPVRMRAGYVPPDEVPSYQTPASRRRMTEEREREEREEREREKREMQRAAKEKREKEKLDKLKAELVNPVQWDMSEFDDTNWADIDANDYSFMTPQKRIEQPEESHSVDSSAGDDDVQAADTPQKDADRGKAFEKTTSIKAAAPTTLSHPAEVVTTTGTTGTTAGATTKATATAASTNAASAAATANTSTGRDTTKSSTSKTAVETTRTANTTDATRSTASSVTPATSAPTKSSSTSTGATTATAKGDTTTATTTASQKTSITGTSGNSTSAASAAAAQPPSDDGDEVRALQRRLAALEIECSRPGHDRGLDREMEDVQQKLWLLCDD